MYFWEVHYQVTNRFGVWDGSTFRFTDSHLFSVTSQGEGGEESLRGLISKGMNPIHKGSTLMASSPPKGPPPNTTTLGDRT